MPLTDDFIKDIEVQYLRTLADLLRAGKIDRQIARDSARFFLTLVPFASSDDMLTKIKSLTDKFPALSTLHVYVLKQVEELKTNHVLEKMRTMMKNNDIDSAINLVQTKNG